MKSLLTLLLLAGAASSMRSEQLPLNMGNTWTYRHAKDGTAFTVRVGAPVWMQSGRTYYYLTGYADATVLARSDEKGNLVALNEETGQELLLVGFGSSPEQWWQTYGRACVDEGQLRKDAVPYDGPGGRWERTVEVAYRRFSCAGAGVESEQFLDNVGMLRRVQTSIAGPRVFDLVYARVGTLVIEPIDRGTFTATVVERPGGEGWDVTLRLDIGFVPGIRLGFDSAQEYEVVLRNAQRNVLWRWSDGQFFSQGTQQKQFGNQWNATIFVPRPRGANGYLEGFTFDAWLTTGANEPKYAASAPMPPPRV